MNRFFRTTPATYEAIRAAMDTASGYPSQQAETWFAPAEQAPRDPSGLCIIAAIPQIAQEFAAFGATEISEAEFAAIIPQSYQEI